jgi:hypothetical protein
LTYPQGHAESPAQNKRATHLTTTGKTLHQGLPVRLFTHFGTVVYYDAALGELRHGPVHEHIPNVTLIPCGTPEAECPFAILGYGDERIVGALTCKFDRSEAADGVDHCTALQFAMLSRDVVTLKSEDLYICAEPSGRITLSRDVVGLWERFRVAVLKSSEIDRVHPLAPDIAARVAELRSRGGGEPYLTRTVASGERALICDIQWLEKYLVHENYHFMRILHEEFGFDIIDCKRTDFCSPEVLKTINRYELIIIGYQRIVELPANLITQYVVLKIDDLENYHPNYTRLLRFLSQHSDMLISPYAYEIGKFFPHRNTVWIPYSSAIEEEGGLLPFNPEPIQKVLVSGSVAWDRPFRTYVFELDDERIAKLGHPGYDNQYDGASDQIVKDKWFKELNKYLAAFCDGHSLRYIHIRAFEIASVGALLMADRLVEPEMNQLGFIDGETCIFCDRDDFVDKVNWALDESNRRRVDEIRLAGMKLTLDKHTTRRRVAEFVQMLNERLSLDIRARRSGVLTSS